MKTAEEIFQTKYRAGADGWMDHDSIIHCMKEYARQVAEQALKDAADKHRDTHKTLSDWEHAVEEIRETPIVTP